jgi:uncharacterized protein
VSELSQRQHLYSGLVRHDDPSSTIALELLRADDDAWIQTYTGVKFCTLNPNPEMVFIEDIAHALSNLCRFAGHVREFYSVAQHSVLVSHYCAPEDALWGLLHDAAEAYLLDMPAPYKRHPSFARYRQHEARLEACIWERFGFIGDRPASIKCADMKVWAAECRDLMAPLHPDFKVGVKPIEEIIRPLPPASAKRLFLSRFELLVGKRLVDQIAGQLTADGSLVEVR